jgi:primosomal protein N' (replication factor Y)
VLVIVVLVIAVLVIRIRLLCRASRTAGHLVGTSAVAAILDGMGYVSVVLLHPSLMHHDRTFTYSLPDGANADVGALVRVPVRGRLTDAVVVDVMAEPDVKRTVSIKRVIGDGLDKQTIELCRWVSEQYLSTFAEAVAAALPQRVASEEEAKPLPATDVPAADLTWLADYRNGTHLARAIAGRHHGGFSFRPGQRADRGPMIASLAAEATRSGRGVLILLPEVRYASEMVAALNESFGDGVAWLGSDRKARERYRSWLDLTEGAKRIAVGGRAAVFAPVRDLGLVIVDDESHVSYKERRAPRFQARAVAAERARRSKAVIVAVGTPPSVEAYAAVERKALVPVEPERRAEMGDRAAVMVVEAERHTPSGRSLALAADATGRVVILTHRGGEEASKIYERAVRVLKPKHPARLDAATPKTDLRRELKRADLIVATPVIAKDIRMESVGLVVICAADAALASPEFRAAEEAFATWWNIGRWAARIAIETNQREHPAVKALVRWDPDVLLAAEAARRRELGYPPYAGLVRVSVATVVAPDVAKQITEAIPDATVLGPIATDDEAVIAVRLPSRVRLVEQLRPLVEAWRADEAPVRVDVDPREVL